jgi:hypothetical protein
LEDAEEVDRQDGDVQEEVVEAARAKAEASLPLVPSEVP